MTKAFQRTMDGKNWDKPIDRLKKRNRRPKVYTLIGYPIPFTEKTMDPEGVPSWMKRKPKETG